MVFWEAQTGKVLIPQNFESNPNVTGCITQQRQRHEESQLF